MRGGVSAPDCSSALLLIGAVGCDSVAASLASVPCRSTERPRGTKFHASISSSGICSAELTKGLGGVVAATNHATCSSSRLLFSAALPLTSAARMSSTGTGGMAAHCRAGSASPLCGSPASLLARPVLLVTLWAAAFGCAKVAHTFPFRPASVVTTTPFLNAFNTRCTRFGGMPDSARCRPAILSVLTSWLCPNEHSIVLSFTVARTALVRPVEDNKSNGGQNLFTRSRSACQCFSRSCTVVGHPASFTLAAIEGLLLDAAFSAAPALSAAPTATAAPFAFRLSLVAV